MAPVYRQQQPPCIPNGGSGQQIRIYQFRSERFVPLVVVASTPYAGYADNVRLVYSGGSLRWSSADNGDGGVRPALFLAPDTLVSDTTDTDGAYILQWNQPPTTPSSISHGTPRAGQKLTISTGGSTDPEGNAISYVWERRVDSGAYTQIGITSAKSITDTVPSIGTNYQVRVEACPRERR